MLGFNVLWGLENYDFIVYELYILSLTPYPTPKPDHHTNLSAFLHSQINMI